MLGNPDKVFPDGVYCVVGPQEVQQRTADGCRIVKVLTSPQGQSFLLRRERDAAHEDLRRTVTQLNDANQKLNRRISDLERAKATADKVNSKLEAEIERQEQAAQKNAEDKAAVRNAQHRLEESMAKVRAFIGEKAWKEALAT